MEIPLSYRGASGKEVRALFIAPSGWLDPPVAILCRGEDAADSDGQDRQLADYLQSEGIASLLLDFSARAIPPELTAETLAVPIRDLRLAFDALRARRGFASTGFGVYGTGFAGTVGLLCAATDPRVRALVVRSSPAPGPAQPAFVKAPTLIVVGAEDPAGRAATGGLERGLTGAYELRIVPRADRQFANLIAFNRVARDTVAWFARHLGTGLLTRRA